MRSLIDPSVTALRNLPREERDLCITANNSYALAFDNVSGLSAWISDALCRLATGGGASYRALYTDADEAIFDLQRPIIINGIEDVVRRPDLADRSLFLHLAPISKDRRRLDSDLELEIDATRPAILGALLEIVAHGLRMLPDLAHEQYPRMADFAHWMCACESAVWKRLTFLQAYSENIEAAVATVISADLVAPELVKFMADKAEWTGTVKDLLGRLRSAAEEWIVRSREWPQTPEALSGRLRRLAPALRKAGIGYVRLERHNNARPIKLTRLPGDAPGQPSRPSRPSQAKDSNELKGDGGDGPDVGYDGRGLKPSPDKSLINKGSDSRDGRDSLSQTLIKSNGGWIPREERIALLLKHGLSQEEAEAAAREWDKST